MTHQYNPFLGTETKDAIQSFAMEEFLRQWLDLAVAYGRLYVPAVPELLPYMNEVLAFRRGFQNWEPEQNWLYNKDEIALLLPFLDKEKNFWGWLQSQTVRIPFKRPYNRAIKWLIEKSPMADKLQAHQKLAADYYRLQQEKKKYGLDTDGLIRRMRMIREGRIEQKGSRQFKPAANQIVTSNTKETRRKKTKKARIISLHHRKKKQKGRQHNAYKTPSQEASS